MRIFKVNKFIILKLEGEKTIIYISGKRYDQCKALVLNIPIKKMARLDEIESIDEAVDTLKRASKETVYSQIQIPPETEFWGHCSNLQVWAEHNYNTRLLHSNLAFDLLRALSKAGDFRAKRIYKEEIAKRFTEGYESVNEFLVNSRLLNVLDKEEFLSLLDITEATAIRDLEDTLGKNLEILPSETKLDIPGFWLRGKQIIGLCIESSELEYLPDSIGNLKQMKWLYLLENNLETLPDSIGRCKSLELLDLRGNKLTSIPEAVGNLGRLEELMLSRNCLKTLPNAIKDLRSLKYLGFIENEIEELFPEKMIREMEKKGVNVYY